MPAPFTLSDSVSNELGAAPAIGVIQLQAYLNKDDGTRFTYGAPFTTNAAGVWSILIDTTAIQANPSYASWNGYATVELSNTATTGQLRSRSGKSKLQVGSIVGAFGDFPVPDNSITGAKLQNGSLAGVTGDAKLGNRTFADKIAGTLVNSNNLTTSLSFIVRRIREIMYGTGSTGNWSDAIAASTANTGTIWPLVSTIRNKGSAPGAYGLAASPQTTAPSNGATNDVAFVHGSAAGVYKNVSGTGWTAIASNAASVLPSSSNPVAETVGATAAPGTATTYSRSDHRHSMPGRVSATSATAGSDGFMSFPDKYKLDNLTSGGGGGGSSDISSGSIHGTSSVVITAGNGADVINLDATVLGGSAANAIISASVSVFAATGLAGTAQIFVEKNGVQINSLTQSATIPTGTSGAAGLTTLSMTLAVLVNNGDTLTLHVDNIGTNTFTVLANSAILTYIAIP
jgi:hypothetical protein